MLKLDTAQVIRGYNYAAQRCNSGALTLSTLRAFIVKSAKNDKICEFELGISRFLREQS